MATVVDLYFLSCATSCVPFGRLIITVRPSIYFSFGGGWADDLYPIGSHGVKLMVKSNGISSVEYIVEMQVVGVELYFHITCSGDCNED